MVSTPIGGGNAATLAFGQNLPSDVVTNGVNVYWTTQSGIAVDANNVYWTNYGSGTVMSVPIGGGTLVTLANTTQESPDGIVVDGTSVYWANANGNTTKGSISKLTPK